MQNYRNIAFISQGVEEDLTGLKLAMQLTNEAKAQLSVIIIYPELPQDLIQYKPAYDEFLLENIKKSTTQLSTTLSYQGQINFLIDSASPISIRLIQTLIKEDFDLVIKEVEDADEDKGFRSLDMQLLRKCPCPLLITRALKHEKTDMQIAVAIDPEDQDQASTDLAISLLQRANNLCAIFNARLNIVSCWDYEFESKIRKNSFVRVPEEELQNIVRQQQYAHLNALEALINKSKIPHHFELHHLRGQPGRVIPKLIAQNNIDLLVMGTVGRTGIAGFFIGNTAEDILQQVECSLLAIKPKGFISPVKAY